jgi:hypothetical protein
LVGRMSIKTKICAITVKSSKKSKNIDLGFVQ